MKNILFFLLVGGFVAGTAGALSYAADGRPCFWRSIIENPVLRAGIL
jgi:hypothetical protein